jgi:hypothetical protein
MSIVLPITFFLGGGILSVLLMLLFIYLIERPSSEDYEASSHLIEIAHALTELTMKARKESMDALG